MRRRPYSIHTEGAYGDWIKRFVRYQHHPPRPRPRLARPARITQEIPLIIVAQTSRYNPDLTRASGWVDTDSQKNRLSCALQKA